jgi:hypothetical protein
MSAIDETVEATVPDEDEDEDNLLRDIGMNALRLLCVRRVTQTELCMLNG